MSIQGREYQFHPNVPDRLNLLSIPRSRWFVFQSRVVSPELHGMCYHSKDLFGAMLNHYSGLEPLVVILRNEDQGLARMTSARAFGTST